MASITRRGDLQWQARVRRKGYPVQIETFNTRAEAEAWARLIESEIDRGVLVSRAEAKSTTLAEALDRYDREIAAAKKGYVQEAFLLRMWKSTVIASRPMASVRSADIAKLRDDSLKQTNPPLKPASVVRRLAVLSHVFSIVRKEWGMESLFNPLELVRKPPANNARTRRIAAPETDTESARQTETGELERVMAASGSDLLPAIIWLAVETATHASARRGIAPYGMGWTTGPLPSSRSPACTLSQTEPDCRTNSRPNTLARGRSTWQKTACVKVISSPQGGSDSIDRPNLISRSSRDVVVA